MTTRIALQRGDLTQFTADVIVNSTTGSLLGGSGSDGAIHEAAGPGMLKEIQRIRETKLTDGLPAGEIVSTNGGNLPAKWVIHTVSPVWDADEDRSQALTSCYVSAIELADKLGAVTIAFPAIGVGGDHGWPAETAAAVALDALASTDTHLELATFVLHDDETLVAFERTLSVREA